MLTLATIANKKTITNTVDGERILDLTETIFNKTVSVKITKPIIVTEEFEGRPAYLSKVVMGDESHLDLLCSINGISNPMTIQAGMILLVPELTSMQSAIKDNSTSSVTQVNQAMVALNAKYNPKFNTVDPNRIAVVQSQTGEQLVRTPNMTPPNTVPVTKSEGAIVLGTNTSTTRCQSSLTEAQTRTEIIRNAVRSSLLSNAISQAVTSKQPVTIAVQSNGAISSSAVASAVNNISSTAVASAIAATKVMQSGTQLLRSNNSVASNNSVTTSVKSGG